MRRPGAGPSRRSGFRGIGGSSAAASLGVPADIDNLHSWWRADTGITTEGGAVSTWAPRVGSFSLTQGTGSAQPTHITSNAAFNNQPSVSFDGGDSVNAATASDWTFMHDGSGMTWIIVAKGDVANTIYGHGGTSNSTTVVGTRFRTNGVGTLLWDMGNGTTNIMNQTIQANVDDALFHCCVRYEEGRAGNEFAHRYLGGADTTGNSAAAPSASDPSLAFGLGGATLTLTGDIAEVILYSRYITDAEVDSIDAYLLDRYGV